MAFRKGADSGSRLSEEELAGLTDEQRLNFPSGLKYARDGSIWMVVEAFKSGPDDVRRVVSTDDGVQEVMLLNVLRKDSEQGDFTFIKEG